MARSLLFLFFASSFLCAPVFSQIAEEAEVELGSAILPTQEELPADNSGGDVQENLAEADVASDVAPVPLAESNFDLMLYGGLTLLVLGIPAALYKIFCTSGDSPSGLTKVVSLEREGGGKLGGAPPARYNTEQLRQTVARLRAQV